MKKAFRLNEVAFSLIEVTLSLGIVSFALVPVLGLLALGLDRNRSSLDSFLEAQIVASVEGDLRTKGNPSGNFTLSFDEFGVPSSSGSAAFTASMSPDTAPIPGSDSTLKRWTVVVTADQRNHRQLGSRVIWGMSQ